MFWKSTRRGVVLAMLLGPLILWTSDGQGDEPTRDFKPRVVLRRPIRPIVDAPTIPAIEATDEIVTDNELILGIEIKGVARAYPINMLTGPMREIINDQLAGHAIAATW